MTEDAVRWQPPEEDAAHSGARLPRAPLRRRARPTRRRSELKRQAHALGQFVTEPKNAKAFPPRRARARRCPKASSRRRPPMVESIRVSRRAHPTAACCSTSSPRSPSRARSRRSGDLFDMNGGCTVVIDPQGDVRYAIYKRLQQRCAQGAPARRDARTAQTFWKKTGRRFELQRDILRRLHASR